MFIKKTISFQNKGDGTASISSRNKGDGTASISIWNKWQQIIITCLLTIFFYGAVTAAGQSLLQQGIAEEVIRFHVLANSDSEADQRVKLQVRDTVLAWAEEQMMKGNISSQKLANNNGIKNSEIKHEIMLFIQDHMEALEAVANSVLKSSGFSYEAKAELTRCYFPERTYGACTFPAGWYEALRIKLGKAEGQNWWCVFYPKLCFADCLHAVMEEEQMQKLEEVLTVEEYESLLQEPSRWKIGFRWF